MQTEIVIKGQLWNFKEDKKGYECGEFGEAKENVVKVDALHYERLSKVLAKRQKAKWDNWIVYCGDEGDGKSTIAKQDCAIMPQLCDGRKFSVDNISWEPKKFGDDIDNSEPGDSLLYDETITGFNSKRSMSEINNILLSKAVMCRKKRLFIGLCIPSLFSLQKEIAVRRSFGMVKVYTDQVKRGYFSYYNRQQKRMLYIKGKKYEDMAAHKGSPGGTFGRWSTINEIEYERLKDEAQQRIVEQPQKFDKFKIQRNILLKELSELTSQTNVSEILKQYGVGMARNSISDAIKTINIPKISKEIAEKSLSRRVNITPSPEGEEENGGSQDNINSVLKHYRSNPGGNI